MRLSAAGDPSEFITTIAYDTSGRVTDVTPQDGASTHIDYQTFSAVSLSAGKK